MAAASEHGRIADLLQRGRPREAREACAQALAHAPGHAGLHELAGLAAEALGDAPAAEESYRRALGIDPLARIALQNLGGTLARLGRLEEACTAQAAFAAACADRPEAHHNHADALLALDRADEARAACQRALALDPDHGPALLTLGFAQADAGEFAAAAASFARAHQRAPQSVQAFARRTEAHPGMGSNLDPASLWLWRRFERLQRCDWDEREAVLRGLRAIAADPQAEPDRALAFAAMHTPLSAGERWQLARAIAAPIEQRVPALAPLPARAHPGPLRVGLLSPDIRDHLGARLLLPLFELADRARIEWVVYALSPDDGSAIRRRLKAAVPRLREVATLHVADAAAQVRRDRIDILLDAGGHTAGTAFEITAARPAPLQVQYLAFPGTLGSSRVDCALVDAMVAPPEHAPHWSEALVRLPYTHFLYDFRVPATAASMPEPTRAEYGLPADALVLCAFHKGAKIDPETFGAWLEILRQLPRSLLWLVGTDPHAQARLRAVALAQGIDAGRLHFAPYDPLERYLARYRLADLFVDALYHNGMTTVCDALAAGLPVATALGDTFTSRSAASLVAAAGMPELACPTRADFVGHVVRLASDGEDLARRRAQLLRREAPLFDTAARVRDIERALLDLWARACAGGPAVR